MSTADFGVWKAAKHNKVIIQVDDILTLSFLINSITDKHL